MNREAPIPALLLLVEDDIKLSKLLHDFLTREGYRLQCAKDLQQARAALSHQPQLVILDRNLQHEEGLKLLPDVQMMNPVPAVLVLSAMSQATQRVQGLEAGADDYLAKPFLPRELLLRIQKLLQRHPLAPSAPVNQRYTLEQEFVYDSQSRNISRPDHTAISLSEAENELLLLFCQCPGEVLSRDQIQRQLKGYEHQVDDRSIDVRVQRLRKKLAQLDAAAEWIQTVRGQGYRLHASTKASLT